MEHTEIRRKLSAYLDNAVSAEEKEEIKRHLGSCGNCRGALADLEWTIEHLKRLPEVEPPPWLTAKIMAKVRDSSAPQTSLWRRLFFPLRVKLPLEAVALIFLSVTGYYLVRTVGPQGPQIAPPQVSGLAPAPAASSSQRSPALSGAPSAVPLNKGEGAATAPFSPPAYAPVAAPVPAPALPDSEAAPAAALPDKQVPEPELQPATEWGIPNRTAVSPATKEENVAPRKMMKQKKGADESFQPAGAARAPAALREAETEVALSVDDPGAAAGRIEQVVTHFGGRISGHSYSADSYLLFVQIEARKLPDLLDRLGQIGTVQERPQLPEGTAGKVDLVIRW
jgi:hypothetical protein